MNKKGEEIFRRKITFEKINDLYGLIQLIISNCWRVVCWEAN